MSVAIVHVYMLDDHHLYEMTLRSFGTDKQPHPKLNNNKMKQTALCSVTLHTVSAMRISIRLICLLSAYLLADVAALLASLASLFMSPYSNTAGSESQTARQATKTLHTGRRPVWIA